MVRTSAVEGLEGLELHPVRVRLGVRFRGVEERFAVLVHGPAGWGEFSPFPEYPPAVTRWWAGAAIEAATLPPPPARRTTIEVNLTVPAVAPEAAFRMAAVAGARVAKVKVAEPGQRLEDDVARVAAVRDGVGPDGAVRIDANGAWDVATAVLAISRLAAAAGGLEYVEQPCRSLSEVAEVRRRVAVPIAVDESLRTAPDARALAGSLADVADVVVLKVQPLGGTTRALEVAAAVGLPVVVSSALETSVGLATGVALAAALPELPYACGLGTGLMLTDDVVADRLVPFEGTLAVRAVAPDPARLADLAPDEGTAGRLVARLEEAVRAGRAGG